MSAVSQRNGNTHVGGQAGVAEAPLMEVRGLRKEFKPRANPFSIGAKAAIKAVDDVSFDLGEREAIALVGESGSGKTTLAKLLLNLETPTGGDVLFRGLDVTATRRRGGRDYRSAVQAVFQDPSSSLDPRRSVRQSIAEPLQIVHRMNRAECHTRVRELLELVGLPSSVTDNYPHELSGGMQQRVAIARALAPWPSVIVLDEPVSSLDVSIKAQVMNLLKDLQQELGLSYVVIAHDLATVRFLADRVAVMYLGRIVESGTVDDIFGSPSHPYTKTLVAASVVHRPGEQVRDNALMADVGSASDLPSGCRFHPRCPWANDLCQQEDPASIAVRPGHKAACHAYGSDPARPTPDSAALQRDIGG